MRADNYSGVTTFCCMCSNVIGEDRPKTAITCSKECTEKRKQWRRSREDNVRCRYCLRPSSHAERSRYQRWRRFEAKNPPPDAELSQEELAEKEYRKSNPPKKRGPKPKDYGATVDLIRGALPEGKYPEGFAIYPPVEADDETTPDD